MYKINVGVLVEKDSKLLLIKQPRHDGELSWNLVRGELEPTKDIDLFATTKRIAKEQLNVSVELKSLENILIARKSSGNVVQFDFVVETKDHLDKLDTRFIGKEELVDMGPLDFFNSSAYASIHDWIEGKRVSLDLIENVTEQLPLGNK